MDAQINFMKIGLKKLILLSVCISSYTITNQISTKSDKA